jgi:hypothetical protein
MAAHNDETHRKSGLLEWTGGCVCHEQERSLVSFGVDLLCGAAVGSVDSFPWSACVLAGLAPCFDLECSLVTQARCARLRN